MKVKVKVELICGNEFDSKYIQKLGYDNNCGGGYEVEIYEYDSNESPFAVTYPAIGEKINIWDYKTSNWFHGYVKSINHMVREPQMGSESYVDVVCVQYNRYTYERN